MSRGHSVHLGLSGLNAVILPDGFSDNGYVLDIGGAEQSHVDLDHPESIFYEYLRRVGNIVDTIAPPGEPISAAHLGAGGLTLPRYIQATRPGSPQTAVEIERELPSLVLRELPLPAGTRLNMLTDDARAALSRLTQDARSEGGDGLDLVFVDIFSGKDSPEHLACRDFYAEALATLSDRGVLVVNVGDDPGLRFFARQAQFLSDTACEDPRIGTASGAWTLADATMISGRQEGNLILAAGPGLSTGSRDFVQRWKEAGPHPAEVLDPLQTQDFTRKLGS
ncbi:MULTISPECIES: spermidine synthase [Micrococcaceae]|uniref:spermidine synthase n=1 Tax=unclassified Kocuria TaxID=2649579 RepID=UPI001011FABA|nr:MULTISPECIES: fused MFS/spermidine synthase [unclassified Kocuria]